MSIISMVASLCLLCAPEAWAQKRRSERELAGLAGPVRVVREYRTFSRRGLKPAEISELPGGRPYRTVTYDREGNLLEEEYLFGLRYTYTYDADGLKVKTAHGDRSPGSGKPIAPYVAQRDDDEYDASGSKIETVTYLRGDADPWSREGYEYDERGRMRRLSRYWRDSAKSLRLSHVVTYTYGVKGQEEEVIWRDAAGALMDRLSYSNYKYDRRGNWVERTEARFQVYDSRQPKEQWGTVYRVIIYY